MNVRRLFALVVLVALVAGACGRSDDEEETGSGAETTETTAEGGSGGDTAAGSFGDLEEVCSDGDAAGATAQGVTDGEIAIGTFSDPGFAGRQGLNQELFDAAEVFSAWCNEAGGINGRQIKVNLRDAKLTEFKQRVIESCREDFMMVGGGAVFDDTGQEERLGCLLPDISGFVVSSKARGADLLVQPVPNVLTGIAVGVLRYVAERFPDSVENVGYLTGNLPATVLVNDQKVEAGEALDFKTVYNGQYNAAGETSWTPFAQQLQSNEVKGLLWTGEPENLAKLLQATSEIGYEIDWVATDANHLDQKLIDTGGSAVRNVFVQGAVVPYTRAEDNPATQQYLDLFEQYLPDGKAEAYLGFQAFSAWLLFATAAKECGAELTRRCVFDNAQAVTEWTGGGLHATTNPSSGEAAECGLITEGTPEGFVVAEDFEANEGIFNCDADNVFTLEGDYGRGVTLEDVGKTLDELE